MYTNNDIKDLYTLGNSSTSDDVNKIAMDIISTMRQADIFGINIVSERTINEGALDEKKEIKIDVPSKSELMLDDKEMSGMELARWYKKCMRDFIVMAVTISDITSGESTFGDLGMTEEETDELLNDIYVIKAKVRDEEWTKEKANKRRDEFDNRMREAIEEIKKDNEGFIEI